MSAKAVLGSRVAVALSDCAADNGVSGRNCDRAVKGSPALETFDERGGLFQIHAAEDEV
jgi:hypothetical protein